MRYEGYNGAFTVDAAVGTLTITRDSGKGKSLFKGVAARVIPLQAISGVRFKEPSGMPGTKGYLTLGLGGSPAPELGDIAAMGNGDTLAFVRKERDLIHGLYEWLNQVVAKNQADGIDSSSIEYTASGPSPIEVLQGTRQAFHEARAEGVAKAAGVDTSGALFVGQSHESGRNATVTLWPDRIERVKAAAFSSMSRAKQDVEVTPMRSVTSVQAKKDGVLVTKVTVYASGNNIDFRFPHSEADRFRNELQRLLLEPAQASAPVVIQQAAPDLADQLLKLAGLRDQGILSEEEFAAKKAQILERM